MVFIVITGQFQNVLDIFIQAYPQAITQQTASAAAFPIGIMVSSPAIILVALAIWALVRASRGAGE